MENKSHALAAGAFVLLCSALLLGLAWWLTRDAGQRVRVDVISTDAVTGVQSQSPVRYKGVDVGTVRAVRLDPNVRGQVLIELQIDPATPLTQGSTATLAFQGVTGLAFVQIDDRGANPAPLEFGAGAPPRLTLQPNWISQLGEQGSGLVQGARTATERMNALLAPNNQQALRADRSAQSDRRSADGA
jgi:phospholipid/cholesterol/gamma-HCH transport system substrate-binding protein